MSGELKKLAEQLQAIPSMASPWRADTFLVRAITPAGLPGAPSGQDRVRDNIIHSGGMLPPSRVQDAALAASYVAAAHPAAVLGLIRSYEDAERENDNLRATLEWLAGYAVEMIEQEQIGDVEDKKGFLTELGRRLEGPFDEGGVTRDPADDDKAETEALCKLLESAADQLEDVYKRPSKNGIRLGSLNAWANWVGDAIRISGRLRSAAAEREVKKPVVLTAREMAERAAKASVHRNRR